MVENLVLKAEKRDKSGSRVSRKLREASRVPVIIYGHGEQPLAVSLDYHDLVLELQHHHRLLDVEIDGKKQQFLVKDVQYDHLGDKVIHADLTRVDLDERVKVSVTVELKGTPVGVTEGGTLDQMEAEIELECVVTKIPETLRAKVNELNIGDFLLAKDIELPPGATLVTDAETPIATVRVVAAKVEEEVEEAAEGEPEVITAREKSEDEASEE